MTRTDSDSTNSTFQNEQTQTYGSATGWGDIIHDSGCGCPLCTLKDDVTNPESNQDLGPPVVSPNAPGSLQDLADYLRIGYWNDAGTVTRKYNLGSTGPNPKLGVLEYNLSGFSNKFGVTDSDGISEDRKELVREAFKIFEEVLGIDFVETTSQNAEFHFSDNQAGAYATSSGFSEGLEETLINIAASWSGGTSTFDDYTLQTIMHEIGHGLGLGHQGLYNGSGNYADDAEFANDSWQASMMSYFSQTANTYVNASYEFLQTPMAVDWLALQDIYGDGTYGTQNAFEGNTVYGFNTNISSQVSDIWASFADFADRTASTIIDASGIDTLNFSGYSSNQRIDLTVTSVQDDAPTTMDIGGRSGNLTLAAGTVIENARGGSGNDMFFGNQAENTFWGNGGADVFYDSAGDDTYFGGNGNDQVNFASDFLSYSFEVAGDFLQVISGGINAAIDLVDQSIEWLSFTDETFSYDDLATQIVDPPESQAVLEFGKTTITQSSPGVWTTVSFEEEIQDAIVALGPVTFNGPNPVAPRIRNVTDDGFEILLQEFSYHDGVHVTETVSWVAASAGVHEIGGLTVEAGETTSATNEAWASEAYSANFSDAPVVFAQIASTNEQDGLVTRIRNADADGFDFQLQEEEAKNGIHAAESIQWIAFEQGKGTAFDAALTPDAVTHRDYGVSFDPISDTSGVFLAGMQTRDGRDTANVRLRSLDDDSATFFVHEEKSADSEIDHITEVVGFLTAEDGLWFA